ncbi:hypothetical protein QJQ45_010214 [Haematococcus lacustris]|nr:hypothetical protein QJQ45_010214 [Haematococcus lacustris]
MRSGRTSLARWMRQAKPSRGWFREGGRVSDKSTDCDGGLEGDLQCPRYVHAVVLCCLVAIICSIDRTAMSVAILPMSAHYGWSSSVKGAVSSSFNWGHMITNVVGGYAAAVTSPKHVLSVGVVVWSIFTVLTPGAAATRNLPLLLLVRAAMGLGEGVAFPTMQAIIKGWVPADKRSRALSLLFSGHQIGSICSLLISPPLIQHGGLPLLFCVYGSLGFLWLAFWLPWVSASPPLGLGPGPSLATHHHHGSGPCLVITEAASSTASAGHFGSDAGLRAAAAAAAGASSSSMASSSSPGLKRSAPGGSKAGVPSGAAAQLRLQEVPWRKFLACRPLWAIAVCHATFGFTYSICIAWLPTYYSEVFSLDVRQSSTLSVLPWAAMALGTNLSGWTADGLVNGKVHDEAPSLVMASTGKTRKLLQTVGCGGPALALLYLALVPQRGFLGEAVTLLTLAMGLLGFQAAGFAANHQDIASRYASVLFGATNAAASLAGSIGVYAVGVVLDRTSSWPLVLAIVACLNFAAAVSFATLATSEPLFE